MKYCLTAMCGLSILFTANGCATMPTPAGSSDAGHNSRNALDWAGTYKGVLPCADCEGIETIVTLKGDGTYSSTSHYLGKDGGSFGQRGSFQWDADGNGIRLSGDDPARYRLGENRLTRLALDGTTVSGPLADHYVLTKLADEITEKYWKLVELRGQPVARLEREPHLILKAEGNRVNGFAGCNNFTGTYTLDTASARIHFNPLASTEKFCATGMDVEDAFKEVLGQVDNYSLNGDHLTLNRARMAPLARFEAVYLR